MESCSTLDKYVIIALEQPGPMLTLIEFIRVIGFPIDVFMMDRFWWSLHHEKAIYVDDKLISWMGYTSVVSDLSDAMRKRKKSFKKLLISVCEPHEYRELSTDVYERFRAVSRQKMTENLSAPIGADNFNDVYPPALTGRGHVHDTHLLLSPRALKLVMLKLTTPKAKQIANFYLALEEVIAKYICYQTRYGARQSAADAAEKDRINRELQDKLAHQETKLAEQEVLIVRCTGANEELTEKLLSIEHNQTLFIISSFAYMFQGLYLLSFTADLRARLPGVNTYHALGDNMFIIKAYKVHNAREIKRRIKNAIIVCQQPANRDFFKIPGGVLIGITDRAVQRIYDEERDVKVELSAMFIHSRTHEITPQYWVQGVELPPAALANASPAALQLLNGTVKALPAPEDTAAPTQASTAPVAPEQMPTQTVPEQPAPLIDPASDISATEMFAAFGISPDSIVADPAVLAAPQSPPAPVEQPPVDPAKLPAQQAGQSTAATRDINVNITNNYIAPPVQPRDTINMYVDRVLDSYAPGAAVIKSDVIKELRRRFNKHLRGFTAEELTPFIQGRAAVRGFAYSPRKNAKK